MSNGHSVITGFYSKLGTPLEIWLYDDVTVTPDPDPKTCFYDHFNLSTYNLGRTRRYNCWGFTFMPRRYWLRMSAVNTLLADNCVSVSDGNIQVGDIIRYQDAGVTQHTGRVWQTDGSGHATSIRSKWGGWAEYIHDVDDVPESYGMELAYFRQTDPIRGEAGEINRIADLWIKDSPSDNAEQGARAPWWTSPDILVDAHPCDGTPDVHPVSGHPNRVWAVVHNRTNQHVDNVFVRFYWADPAAGLPPANWNLIASSGSHPNPSGPYQIDGNAQIETEYVEWTPTAAPIHQCLLAIAYINDNPEDSNNPDPLVYSFNIPWDNNLAQRNVEVWELGNGQNKSCSIDTWNPFPHGIKVSGSIQAVLTFSPRLPILGFPREIRPLNVSVNVNQGRAFTLKPLEKFRKNTGRFIHEDFCSREKKIGGLTIPNLVFNKKEPQRINIEIAIPREIPKGSVYYLHVYQIISNAVTGGYTWVIVVV